MVPRKRHHTNATRHWEYASALVPINIKVEQNVITNAIANFPPIAFINTMHSKGKQHMMIIKKMNNRDYYKAVNANNNKKRMEIKHFRLFNNNIKLINANIKTST